MPGERRASDSGRWEQINRVFHGAVHIEDTGAREAYLQAACVDAPDLLAEVRSLLDWDRASTDFLDVPLARVGEWGGAAPAKPDAAATGAELLGAALGPWLITGVIGRGGMGTVYRAERADAAFERQAAIKVVRAGRESLRMIERFHRE